MQAYLNDKKLKSQFVAEIKRHEKADAIVQGVYGEGEGENWRGCAVGCSLKSMNGILNKDGFVSDHSRYEPELGIPQVLAHLEDRIFEWLDPKEAKKWPRRFAEAVPVGADLSHVWPKFAIWLLTDSQDGVIKFAKGRPDIIEAIKRAASIYKAQEAGKPMTRAEIYEIRQKNLSVRHATATDTAAAAYATADYATDAAAADAAYSAAAAAADAAYTAAYAAYATAYAAAYADTDATADAAASAVRKTTYLRMSKKLLQLIKACR